MYNNKIKNLNSDEKPREKLIFKGPNTLSDSDLLAIIIDSGGKEKSALEIASDLIRKHKTIKQVLELDIQELKSIKYLGITKSVRIKALHEIFLRINTDQLIVKSRVRVENPEQAFQIIKSDFFDRDKEMLYVLYLNSRNELISKELVSVGTVNETLVHPREVFKEALRKSATSIVLAHNHPSGNVQASREDIQTTIRIIKAGTILGLNVVDHLIVHNNEYISIKGLGIAWEKKGGDRN